MVGMCVVVWIVCFARVYVVAGIGVWSGSVFCGVNACVLVWIVLVWECVRV